MNVASQLVPIHERRGRKWALASVSNSEMSGFLDEQGGTRVYGEAYMWYVAAENPRTTPLIEKRAIYGWTPVKGGKN
ncbi:MAG: hypothetical protein SWE60_16830 [Thermodesulfobacteriota bacterium]|nr:hypothetical protein [Thermodesulfobacteriota bacterium]